MSVAKIGKRGVLVIPTEIRKKSGLTDGDDVLIDIGESGIIHIRKRPKDFVAALSDLHPEIWPEKNPVDYIKEERDLWDK